MIFINYDKEDIFKVTIILETDNGIIPLVFNDNHFINFYKYLSKKIKEGNTLYINYNNAYLGNIKTEGPYCEQEVFMSNYESENNDFNELIINLNKNIKNNEKTSKKLIKIGSYYK